MDYVAVSASSSVYILLLDLIISVSHPDQLALTQHSNCCLCRGRQLPNVGEPLPNVVEPLPNVGDPLPNVTEEVLLPFTKLVLEYQPFSAISI